MTNLPTNIIQRIAIGSSYLAIASVLFFTIAVCGDDGPIAEGSLAAAGTIFVIIMYSLHVLVDFKGTRNAARKGSTGCLIASSFLWVMPFLTLWYCGCMYVKHAPQRTNDIIISFALGSLVAVKIAINLALLVTTIRNNRLKPSA
jgi:small-conductance mechanosensitive channel